MKWSKAARKMIPVIIVSSLAIICIGVAVFRSFEAVPFAAGVLLAMAFNIFKVYLLDRTVQKAIEMTDADAAKNYVRLQSLLRLFLTGAVLLAAHLIPFTDLLGACAGVVTFHIAVFGLRFMKLYEDDEEGVES
ncbi:MAG: hypothetical protein LBI19_10610 [Oscillospiraceae bacterium]|jgi:hypothetical protein|nr:hypothetical protein [Oscillospiraceae bacterium]